MNEESQRVQGWPIVSEGNQNISNEVIVFFLYHTPDKPTVCFPPEIDSL